MEELKIRFANKLALQHFVRWLEGQGEQSYWDWMDCREYEARYPNSVHDGKGCKGDITVTQFDYPGQRGRIIKTKCGRLDAKQFGPDEYPANSGKA